MWFCFSVSPLMESMLFRPFRKKGNRMIRITRQKSSSPSFSVSPRTKPRNTGTTSRNAIYVYRYHRCGTLLWMMPLRSPKAVRGDPVSIASTQ